MARPQLKATQTTVQEYIHLWGAEHYNDFCDALGLQRLDYWSWLSLTKAKGIDWWLSELELDQITRVPSADNYRMLVRKAAPSEADGPTRLTHFLRLRFSLERMTFEQYRDEICYTLGGLHDPQWMQYALELRYGRAKKQFAARSATQVQVPGRCSDYFQPVCLLEKENIPPSQLEKFRDV